MASVGYATLDIIPSLKGMKGKIEQGLVGPARAAGAKGGDEVGRGMVATIGKKGKGAGRMLAGGLGLGFAAIGVGSIIKSSVQLEASFSKTLSQIAVATGAPKSAMKGIEATALRMGAETSFSANEAAGAMLELGKSGISTRDIMKGGLKGTLTLAAAGSLDLGEAAGIASNAMNVFGLKGRDMNKIAAALAGGANASTASVGSLGQALNQVGPGARNAGLSLQETVGTLAAFDQAGIKGSDAGTSLKTMLTRLTPTTDTASKAMKKYNLDFVDSKGNFDDITTVAQKLKTNLGGLSEAQRTQALSTIFGSDAARAASVLMSKGAKGLKPYIKATKDSAAANRMAKANMSGTAGALERLGGAVETAKLKLGQSLAPTVRKLANYLSNTAVPAVTKFMDQLQTGRGFGGQVASGLGQIKSALGDAFDVGKKLVGVFDDLPSGLKKAIGVGAVAAFVAPKIPGAGVLGGAGKGVAKTLAVKIVGKGVQPVFVTNPGFGKPGTDGPGGGGKGGGKGGGLGGKIATGVGAAGGVAALGVFAGIAVALGGVATAAYKWSKHIEKTTGNKINPSSDNPARNTERTLTPKFSSDPKGAKAIGDLIDKMKGLAGKQVSVAVEARVKGADLVAELATKALTLKDKSVKIAAAVAGLGPVGVMKVAVSGLKNRAVKVVAAVAGGGLVRGLTGAIKAVKGKAVRTVSAVAGTSLVKGLTGAIKSLKGKAVKTLSSVAGTGLVKGLTGAIKALKGKVVKTASTVAGTGLVKGLTGAINAVKGKAVKIGASVSGTGAVQGLVGAIAGVKSKTVSIVTNVFNRIKSADGGPVVGLRRASGGPVWGAGSATSDSIPAMLSDGEYVVRAAAVAKYGVGFMHQVNQLRLAGGGPVRLAKGGQAKKRRERRKEQRIRVRDNRKEFDLSKDLGTGLLKKEFDQLRKLFLLGGKAFAGLEKRAIRYGKAQDKAAKRLETNQEKLAGLKEAKTSLIDTTTSAYRREAFGNGAAGLKLQLEADRNDALTGMRNAQTLDKKGISDGLEMALLASGDTNTLAQLATMSAAEIDKYDLLYAQSQKATADIGKYAGAEAYDVQIKATTDVITKTKATLERLDKRIEGIEKAVERGARKGYSDRVRAAGARRRAG